MRLQNSQGLPEAREEPAKGDCLQAGWRLSNQSTIQNLPSYPPCLFKIPVGKFLYLYLSNGILESRCMEDTIHAPAPKPQPTGTGMGLT